MGFFTKTQASLNKRLFKAIDSRNLDKMKAAIDAGADINAVHPRYNQSVLHEAVSRAYLAGVTLLLEKGADHRVSYSNGYTPLMEASYDGSFAIADLLLKKGVNVNAVDSSGETAMHKAAKRGRGDIIKLLMKYDANKDAVDNRMNTPADLADKEYPRVADMIRGKTRQPETEAQQQPAALSVMPALIEDMADSGWRLTAPDEVANISIRPEIGYRLTEIFNFTSQTYTRIAQNLQSGAESQSLKFFDEFRDAALLQRAQTALSQLGGRTVDGATTAAVRALDKPAMQLPKPQGGM